LTHEHVALDFEHFYRPPPPDFESELKAKISMSTLGYVRLYPYSSKENVRFYDGEALEAAKKDVLLYKKHGGGSIVENSSYGLKRNLEFIVELAKSTGVHFIAGTGHYIHAMQDASHASLTVEQMSDLYSKDIITGLQVNGKVVKCGFIGEVASVYPIHGRSEQSLLRIQIYILIYSFKILRRMPSRRPVRFRKSLAVVFLCIRIVLPRLLLRSCVFTWRRVDVPTNVSCRIWIVSNIVS